METNDADGAVMSKCDAGKVAFAAATPIAYTQEPPAHLCPNSRCAVQSTDYGIALNTRSKRASPTIRVVNVVEIVAKGSSSFNKLVF
jgi:hypothetical protein